MTPSRNISSLLVFSAVLSAGLSPARGATIDMNGNDAIGTSSFNTGARWVGGAIPVGGNDYRTLNFLLRTPTNAVAITFAGDSLEISAGGTLRDKTAAAVTISNLILSGGTLELTQPNNSLVGTGSLSGGITLTAATTSTIRSGILNTEANVLTIDSVISGSGSFTTGANMFGRIILNTSNTFTGGMTVASGGTAAALPFGGGAIQLGNVNAVQNSTVTLSMANGLGFSSGLGMFNLGGLSGTGNSTLADVTGAPVTISVGANNANTTYSGALSDSGGLTKVGTGTLTLTGTNTYSGATNVNSGTLAFSGTQDLGSSAMTVADGASLSVKPTSVVSPVLTTSNLTLGTTGSTNLTFDFNGLNPTIAQISTGLLSLNGTINVGFLGTAGLSTSTYTLIDYTGISGSGFSALTPTAFAFGHSSATLVDNTVDTSVDLSVVADSLVWTGGSSTWSTAATGDGSGINSWATKNGLAATNFWVNDAVEFNDTFNTNVGSVDVTNRAVTITAADVNPSGVAFNNSTGDYTVDGSFGIAGNGGLTKNGTSKVTINTANSYSGGTTINDGTVAINNANSLGATSTALALNSGTLETTADISTSRNIILGSAASTIQVNAGTTYAVNGVLSGAGTLNKTGDGTLTLSATNTFTGGATITAGTISLIETAFNTVKLGAAPLFATPNYYILDGGGIAWNATVDDSFGTTRGIGLGPTSGTIGGTGYFDVTVGRVFGILGIIASAGNSGDNTFAVNSKGGIGTLTLNAFNTYRGTTSVSGGTLGLNVGGPSGTIVDTLDINAGATVQLNAVDALGFGDGTSVTQININGGALNNAVAGNNSARASWTLTGGTMSSTGGGAFNINFLNVGNTITSNASAVTSTISAPVILRSGGGVQIGISVADGAAPTDLLILGGIDQNAGEGANGIMKTGAGTLELAGVNFYTGQTTVDAGTLIVTGSLVGDTTINTATLSGTGTMGAVLVTPTGTLAPGLGLGVLNTGNLTLSGGAQYELELDTATSSSDRVNVSGNLNLDLANTVTLSLTDLGSDTTLPQGTVFTLVDYSGTWNGGTFAGFPDDSVIALGTNVFRISYDGVNNNDAAVVLVVPEPGTFAALLGGIGLLATTRRRRAGKVRKGEIA